MNLSIRLCALVLSLLAVLTLDAQAMGVRQRSKLEQTQITFAATLRWGDVENAWSFVEPAYAQAHPLSEFDLRRFEQIQISGYRELSTQVEADQSVVRIIEVRAISRHTQIERSLRYREHWRWDNAAKRWWLVGGLPDFWGDQ